MTLTYDLDLDILKMYLTDATERITAAAFAGGNNAAAPSVHYMSVENLLTQSPTFS